jgi:hypothetical protein
LHMSMTSFGDIDFLVFFASNVDSMVLSSV